MTNERFTNPFPGLRPFESTEDHLFFGRDGQSDELLRRLRRSRFLAVLGTSGSGKSSLVRAGMLPSLYGGLMTQAGSAWRVALFRPGHDPIGNLAKALSKPQVFGAGDDDDAALQRTIVEATLRRSALGLVEATRQARMPANENLLVVVDQFEEIFRFRRMSKRDGPEDESAAFIKLLLEAKKQTDVPVYIVITMRSDFLGDCAQFRDLPEAINDGQYLIPRMTRDQRREAITGPVAVGGGEIAGRLVNRLLNDVGDDPDHLPILQHALMRTWDLWMHDRRNGEAIDLRHYEAVGTMSEALSRHADEAYDELPNDRSRALAEKLFKSLTEKGPDNREIRRPTRVSEIAEIAGATPAEVISVIEPFRQHGRSFLMPPSSVALDETCLIDISHESLIRGWTRLRKWVDQEARSAMIYRRIADTALLHAEGRAGLWHDPDLALALRWRDENRPNAVWAQHYHPEFERAMAFIDASKTANEAEIAERERARRREVRRSRIFVTVLGIAFLTSLGFLLLANTQRVRANQQTVIARTALDEALKQKRIADEQKALAVESARKAQEAAESEKTAKEAAEKSADAAEKSAEAERKSAEIAQQKQREAQIASQRAQHEQARAEREAQESRRVAIIASKQGSEHNYTTTQLAERLIALTPTAEAAKWRGYRATALTQLHRHNEARNESSRVLQTLGDNFSAFTNRGYMNLINLATEQALKDFEKAQALDPQSSLAYLNLSVAQGNLKRYDDAESSIQKAIDWYRPLYFDGAFDSLVSEDITEATHRSVIIAYGNEFDAALHYELANIAMFRGSRDFETKLEAADRYAEKTESLVEGYLTALNWAWYQMRKQPGDYGALAAQGHLWRKSGYDPWARYYFLKFQCAHREQRDSRYDALASWVTRQLKSLPMNSAIDCDNPPKTIRDRRTTVFEAEELGTAGRYKEALSLLDVGLKEDPSNIELLLNRARYRKWLGDWDDKDRNYQGSREDFAVALKIVDQDPQKAAYRPIVYWWWADFGPLLAGMKDAERRTFLEKALELGPANSYVMSELSNMVAETDPKRAMHLLERSIQFDPTGDKYYRLAKLQNNSGSHQQALESIKVAISLESDKLEFYKERERAETGVGINHVEIKRHLADGLSEIGNVQLRSGELSKAYEAYQEALKALSTVANADESGAVKGDLAVINSKLARVLDANREKVSGRILNLKDGAGKTREGIIDRGSYDGVVAGEQGTLWSVYSKVDNKERKVQKIGTARVVSVGRDSATVEVTMEDPTGDKLVRTGDMVEVSARIPPVGDRGKLWDLMKFHIALTSEDEKKVFSDYRSLYADISEHTLNRILDEIAAEIKSTAARLSNIELMKTVIKKGRFKDQTLRQVMENATRTDVRGMLDDMWQYPATHYGQDVKVARTFAVWVLSEPD